MKYETITTISTSELRLLTWYRRFWILGWLAAFLLLAGFGYQQAKISVYHEALARIEVEEANVREVMAEQRLINDSYEENIQHQQATAATILSIGDYLKDRHDLALGNKNAVVDLMHRH